MVTNLDHFILSSIFKAHLQRGEELDGRMIKILSKFASFIKMFKIWSARNNLIRRKWWRFLKLHSLIKDKDLCFDCNIVCFVLKNRFPWCVGMVITEKWDLISPTKQIKISWWQKYTFAVINAKKEGRRFNEKN